MDWLITSTVMCLLVIILVTWGLLWKQYLLLVVINKRLSKLQDAKQKDGEAHNANDIETSKENSLSKTISSSCINNS